MFVSRVVLKNWRNFPKADVAMRPRMFVVGANASGKSNFLDVFRFMRDISKPGGGLQFAVSERGGLSSIRCLAARRYPDIAIGFELSESLDSESKWRYEIGIKQQPRGDRKPFLAYERVWKDGKQILDRPNDLDKADELRLTQTHLEQINANAKFREISMFFESVTYFHLVPQLVRYSREFTGPGPIGDPFGRSLLERIGRVSERIRNSRLKSIEKALTLAVPQLKELTFVTDSAEGGVSHLEAFFDHWGSNRTRQREREFSDGTLRLLGFLWSLLDGDSLLLLEEPELSLNAAIVRELAPLIHRLQRKRGRQVLSTTHSADLLQDRGIAPEEVILLKAGKEGTQAVSAASIEQVRALLEGGQSIADAVLPQTSPECAHQLSLFE